MSKLLAICIVMLFPLAALPQTASFSPHSFQIPNLNLIQAVGDLNNDGYQDLITLHDVASGNSSLSVFLSKGDGTYRAPIAYTLPIGADETTPALADFNGDGKLDLVVSNSGSSFSIYPGNGDGTFRSPVVHNVTGQLEGFAAADVNHDNKTDLLVLTTSDRSTTNDLYVLLSNGDGTFRAGPVTHNILGDPDDGGPIRVDILPGDFNGDGKVDFAAIVSGRGGTQLEIWLGDGTGNFTKAYSDGSLENFDFVVADVNGDGVSDLVATSNFYCIQCSGEEPYFTVYYGHTNGTMSRTQIPITGGCPIGYPVVADFNGDGIPDIAFGGLDCENPQSASISTLLGKGKGAFGSQSVVYTLIAPPVHYVYYAYPAYGLRGNLDTKADLVLTQQNSAVSGGFTKNSIVTLLNTTNGNFPTCPAPNAAVGMNVCSPASGSSASSPVNFAVGASGDTSMRKVEVWVDGKKKTEQLAGAFSDYSFLNASIPLAAGSHRVVIFANGWDNSLQSKVFTLNVGGSSCTLPSSPGIHVCSPTSGSSVSSPVQLLAAGRVSGTLARMEVWVDGVKKFTSGTDMLNTTLTLAAGSHRFAFLAINTAGKSWENAVDATVLK